MIIILFAHIFTFRLDNGIFWNTFYDFIYVLELQYWSIAQLEFSEIRVKKKKNLINKFKEDKSPDFLGVKYGIFYRNIKKNWKLQSKYE